MVCLSSGGVVYLSSQTEDSLDINCDMMTFKTKGVIQGLNDIWNIDDIPYIDDGI